MALIVVLAIVVLGFGLDRVVRYVTGESRVATRTPSYRADDYAGRTGFGREAKRLSAALSITRFSCGTLGID
jgi:hypothetical protein